MADLMALGCFDEESCRFFLREVGARVVPNYPFSYGMEEVHSLIMEEYGTEGAPDVTSLLQDFLEEDGTSTGIGDDGDIWRSWRHHWRHRNKDALDPYVAKIGTFLLEDPTPRPIRRIKADNYLRKIENEQCHPPLVTPSFSSQQQPGQGKADQTDSPNILTEEEQAEPLVYLTSATYSHQRCRLNIPNQPRAVSDELAQPSANIARKSAIESATSASDSQQDFAEVTASMLQSDFDPSLLLSFEMIEPRRSSARNEDGSLRGGHAPIYTLHPVHYELAMRSTTQDKTAGELEELQEACENDKEIKESCPDPISSLPDLFLEPDEHKSFLEVADRPFTPGFIRPESTEIDHQGNANRVSPNETPELQRKRTANRHARLIDGAIFPLKGRKSNVARPSVDIQEQPSPDAGKRSLFRLSWTPTRQNSGSRRSWLQGVKGLFRSSQNKHTDTSSKHRHTPSIGTLADVSMSKSHDRVASNTASIAHTPKPLGRFFDGACDEVFSPSASPLNKPLPLTPCDIAKSLSSRTRSASIDRSPTLAYPPQSASTTSTKVSQTSSKGDFRALTKELMSTKKPSMYQYDLSPVHELTLNPSKYDPSKSPKPQSSPVSFTSFAQRNPFTEDLTPLTPRPGKSFDAQTRSEIRNYSQYGLPPSRSEPNVRSSSSERLPSAAYYSPPNLPQTPPPSSPELSDSRHDSARGRSKSRDRFRDFVHGESSASSSSPPKQIKRSRSPVKRLLGLGKSTPTKELMHTPNKEPVTPTAKEPTSSIAATNKKKSSLKQWSDRLRHGFLSIDQEEMQREADLEEYLEVAASPEPPSTFPISLDPAYQARLQADVELLVCVTTNKFLLHQSQHGRISKDTVAKVRKAWESKNLPQVLEHQFDQATQRELVLANFRTLRFHGQFANDPVAINSVMLSWGTMAKEMSIRTFCNADSAIKKQLHDAQRLLELLGAPLVTCLAFEQLHVRALATMTKRQKERWARKKAEKDVHRRNISDISNDSHNNPVGPQPRRDYSDASQFLPHHRRNLSEGDFGEIKATEQESVEEKIKRMNTPPVPPPQMMTLPMRNVTGAAGAVMGAWSPSQGSTGSPSASRYAQSQGYGHRYNRSMGGSSGRR